MCVDSFMVKRALRPHSVGATKAAVPFVGDQRDANSEICKQQMAQTNPSCQQLRKQGDMLEVTIVCE
jgi:hypothetical protein